MFAPKVVLHPTDFSENARLALWAATTLAQNHKAKLLLLHVVPPVSPVTGPGNVASLQHAEQAQQEVKAYREEMTAKLRKVQPTGDVAVERLVQEGNVPQTILRTAEERACDIIVMGTHGRTAKEQELMGSVAQEVSRFARCPVLTINCRRLS